MAGPLVRLVMQLVVPLVAVMARALPAAYSQALQNARKAGMSGEEAAKNMMRKTLTKSEALQILNLSEQEMTAEAIQKVWVQLRDLSPSVPLNSWSLSNSCSLVECSNTIDSWPPTTFPKEEAFICSRKSIARRSFWTSFRKKSEWRNKSDRRIRASESEGSFVWRLGDSS